MSRRAVYRKILIVVFGVGLVIACYATYGYLNNRIPDSIRMLVNQEEEFQFDFPISADFEMEAEDAQASVGTTSNIPQNTVKMTAANTVSLKSDSVGQYKLKLKALGFINFKTIDVSVVEKQEVIPCGFPIGIYLQTDGVMIIGSGAVTGMDGLSHEPSLGIVKSGDYITSLNGEKVSSKSQLIYLINKYGGDDIVLGVRRNKEVSQVKIKPVQSSPTEYKLGIWVRDDTQGIGTLTYITEDGKFGALGHGISDIDTSELLDSSDGVLYEAKIWGIKKGEAGSPGGLLGVINYEDDHVLGEINKNTNQGIYGTANEKLISSINQDAAMEIGYKQEIKLGKAYVRCMVNDEIKDYEIEIEKIDLSADNVNKGMVIQITDPELLNLTNGIVQGMSGSPIIQNNKLIGAVTHVFVQNSTKGYGIFIENMLTKTSK